MRKKKFKIFINEKGWERISSRSFYAMCLDHMAEFINRGEVKRRELVSGRCRRWGNRDGRARVTG